VVLHITLTEIMCDWFVKQHLLPAGAKVADQPVTKRAALPAAACRAAKVVGQGLLAR